MPAQKCPYIYSKDEGHKYRLLRKVFYFSRPNTLSLIRNAERHFYSPLRKTFLFFLLIKYLKIKKHSPIQVNALSKFSYFVVYDAYSETLAYLLKCNCLQLYFHVGMGT